jgi:hypothetical protein
MSDIFQEVEEDVRRERYEQLWKKYGNYVIAAAAVLVIAVGGWQAWSAYDSSQRQAVSDQFEAALKVAQSGKAADAEAQFAELSKSGYTGYATLSKFNLVGVYLAQGQRDPAVTLLRELTGSADDVVSSVARLRLAWLEADARPRAEIQMILEPLTAAESPWRFAAAEVLAYAELKSGSRPQAENDYLNLSQEPLAPPGLRQRASAILAYLKANPGVTAVPAAAGAAAPAPAATPAPAPAQTPPPTQGTTKK